MKVVLTRDIKNMGRAHETVEVSDGHALNFLIPKRFAVSATPTAIKHGEMHLKAVVERKTLDAALVSERLNALAEERIVIKKKVNEKGHLYDAVDAAEIATATNLPEEAIRLEKPIKEVGTFDVPVAFGEDFGKVSITIEAE
ncbi:MAG: 50S ribosomal protein L9 [Minisyncoccia bacterium]